VRSSGIQLDLVELSMNGAIYYSSSSIPVRIYSQSTVRSHVVVMFCDTGQFDFPLKHSAIMSRVRSRTVKSADVLSISDFPHSAPSANFQLVERQTFTMALQFPSSVMLNSIDAVQWCLSVNKSSSIDYPELSSPSVFSL